MYVCLCLSLWAFVLPFSVLSVSVLSAYGLLTYIMSVFLLVLLNSSDFRKLLFGSTPSVKCGSQEWFKYAIIIILYLSKQTSVLSLINQIWLSGYRWPRLCVIDS